jgi:hypothetical protein
MVLNLEYSERTIVVYTQSDSEALSSDTVADRLSRAYAEQVERINEMRERLDQISEILVPYLEEPQVTVLDLDDLKRVLDLAEYR